MAQFHRCAACKQISVAEMHTNKTGHKHTYSVCGRCWDGHVCPEPPKRRSLRKEVETSARSGVCMFCGREGAKLQFKGDDTALVGEECIDG